MRIALPKGFDIDQLASKCGVHKASMYRAINDFDPDSGVHNCSHILAAEIHRNSIDLGVFIPCWVLRPDLWAHGQVPPALADLQVSA